MKDSFNLDNYYTQYMSNIEKWLPDGLIEVDLALLQRLNLLHYPPKEMGDSALTRYFQAVESQGKLTLINEQYVIWIVPNRTTEVATTNTLIALHKNDEIYLQLGFCCKGIYNNSQLVLRLLEKFLIEIHDMEETLNKFA